LNITYQIILLNPVGKIAKKQSKGVRFVNSALKIQCLVVKNTLLKIAFSTIFPTGKERCLDVVTWRRLRCVSYPGLN